MKLSLTFGCKLLHFKKYFKNKNLTKDRNKRTIKNQTKQKKCNKTKQTNNHVNIVKIYFQHTIARTFHSLNVCFIVINVFTICSNPQFIKYL